MSASEVLAADRRFFEALLSLLESWEQRARLFGNAAPVTGRTERRMLFGQESVTVRSRHTHVSVSWLDARRFVRAQGTPIA